MAAPTPRDRERSCSNNRGSDDLKQVLVSIANLRTDLGQGIAVVGNKCDTGINDLSKKVDDNNLAMQQLVDTRCDALRLGQETLETRVSNMESEAALLRNQLSDLSGEVAAGGATPTDAGHGGADYSAHYRHLPDDELQACCC